MGRVFAKLGEKKNRQKARLKFVVQKLGIDKFRQIVLEERRTMPEDPTWRKYFDEIPKWAEKPGLPVVQLGIASKRPEGYDAWANTNVYEQRQAGYAIATITCPLGDLTSEQMRRLADITRRYAGDHARLTVEQNIVLRWVPVGKLTELYAELKDLGLSTSGAGTILDVAACPGTDTCKLGIASSRGLAGELRDHLAFKSAQLDRAVKGLRIKISGCFNSCGQHHVADLGFYGNSRNIGGFTVPHFQVMLGGKWSENGGSYGLALGSVPSKRIPALVDRITTRYVDERQNGETFQQFCQRIGKKALKETIDQFTAVPPYSVDPSFYNDWGDPRSFSIGDMAQGECAGEIVSHTQFGFQQAETEAFEAQLLLDDGEYEKADHRAYQAMLTAARTLVQMQWLDVPNKPDAIVSEFKVRFVDTQIFWHRQHMGQFANYLLNRHEGPDERYTMDTAHKLVEEANLFIDAAHEADTKYQQQAVMLPGAGI